jgi:hypothetical protein
VLLWALLTVTLLPKSRGDMVRSGPKIAPCAMISYFII